MARLITEAERDQHGRQHATHLLAIADMRAALYRAREDAAMWKGLFCASCLALGVLIAWVVALYEVAGMR